MRTATLRHWAVFLLVSVTLATVEAQARPPAARASIAKVKPTTMPPNPRSVPLDRTVTLTIPATGAIEPIAVAMASRVITVLRFQYPLKVASVTGSLSHFLSASSEEVLMTPLDDEQFAYRHPPTGRGGAGDATVTLQDGRTLEVAAFWADASFDLEVNIQLPPTCIGPPAPVSCEAERTQLALLTKANASLAHVIQEMALHPWVLQAIVEQRSQETATSEGFTKDAAGELPAFLVPERPFKWQKLPPCDAAAAQETINGGCWVQTSKTAPCPTKTFEHAGKCFIAVAKKPEPAPQSEDLQRRGDQPNP